MLRNTNGKKMMGLALVCAMFSLAVFSSCKKDEEPTKTSTTRTLTKSKLYDKTWYNQGSSIVIGINSNGTIGLNSLDKWRWVNNSDTLLLDYQSGPDRTWIIEWTEDTEMSARYLGDPSGVLFKTTKW